MSLLTPADVEEVHLLKGELITKQVQMNKTDESNNESQLRWVDM